ncbi:MAG: S8 family serine peptidase [Phycisphaerales bacterium]|nr:S8 family serine peptidase [Phycisphaerales bacterium]
MTDLLGRWCEIGALACVGAVVAGGMVGVARGQVVGGPPPEGEGVAEGVLVGPDVVGGWASDRMLIRVREGVKPVRLADGRWTVKVVGAGAGGAGKAPPRKEGERASELVAAAGKRWGVSAIEPALAIAPLNKALAKAHGLDRYYMVYVAPGSDVPGMVKEFGAPAPGIGGIGAPGIPGTPGIPGIGELIELAHVENIGTIAVEPNDSSFNQQWDMHNTGQTGGTPDADVDGPECWDVHQGSAAVILAVIDTGVQHFQANVPGSVDHPDLAGRVITGWNTLANNDVTVDEHGHGTHCAGIAAATGNNGVGVAGMNWNAIVMAMRISNTGSANSTDCSEAVTWATDHGADVISMSLAFSTNNPLLESAVAYAYDSGVLPVAASGNSPSFIYPGAHPKCMAIGATDKFDVKWPLSNSGPQLDVVAPGVAIFNLWKNSGYADGVSAPLQSGTSMATPHVSGLAALMKSHNPALSVAEIEQIIRDTAEDKGAPGFDNLYGWGRLNAAAAIDAATAPGCVGDVTGDGVVNVADLLAVIGAWGACADPENCAADVAPLPDGDGVVNVADLLGVIGAWGSCG